MFSISRFFRTAKYARDKLKFTEVLAWNDMFAETAVDLLKEYNMGELVVPVIWGYAEDVTRLGYFPLGMFGRYAKVRFPCSFKVMNFLRFKII